MIRRPPRSTPKPSSAASDVYKRQAIAYPIRPRQQLHEPLAIPWPVRGSVECPRPSALSYIVLDDRDTRLKKRAAVAKPHSGLRPGPWRHLVHHTTSQVCLYSRPAARAPVAVAADSKKEQQHQEHVNSAFAPAVRSEDSKKEHLHNSTLTARSRWTSRTRTTWST